jgi:hypothetical protein
MADYVDRRMEIDCGRTRARLGWEPTERLCLPTRLPFLIEHARDNPMEWYRRNREAMEHLRLSPGFEIYRLLKRHEERIEQELSDALYRRELEADPSPKLTAKQRLWDHRVTLRNLLLSVRTGRHAPLLDWCRDLAERRLGEDFDVNELVHALRLVDSITVETLLSDSEGAELGRVTHDEISSRIEFAIDRVLEVYEDAAVFGREGLGV